MAYLLAAEKEKYFFFNLWNSLQIRHLTAVQKLGGICNDIICAVTSKKSNVNTLKLLSEKFTNMLPHKYKTEKLWKATEVV